MSTPLSQQTNLRTLRLAELSTIIEDINYNFGLLRSHPMFQGIKGDTGTPGTRGSAGTRGSRWLFLYKNEFQRAFPTTNFNALDTTNKWIEWLNNQINNAATLQRVLNCFSVDEFVTTDICVLPNTALLEFNSLTNKFVDTGHQINSEAGYVRREELLEEIAKVKRLINEDIEYLGIPSFIKSFQDGADAANLTTNAYSYLDPVIGQNSIQYKEHRWFGPNSDDTNISVAKIFTLLTGLKEWYHELVQNTIISNNLSSQFVPGPGRMPAMVMIQNDTNSGMLLGPKPELFVNPTLDKFGRIFMGEGRSIIGNSVARNIGEYGLHLFSNPSGNANNGIESEVFITPATIYLISSLIDIAKDLKVHGTSTLEGYAKFLDNVDIRKKLTADILNVHNLAKTGELEVRGVASVGTLKISNVEQGSGNKVLIIENGTVKYVDPSIIAPPLGVAVTRAQLDIYPVTTFTEKLRFGSGFVSGTNLNSLVSWIENMYNYLIGRITSLVNDGMSRLSRDIADLRLEFRTFATNTNTRITNLSNDILTLSQRHNSDISNIQALITQLDTRINDNTTAIRSICGLKVGQIIDIYSANDAEELYDTNTLRGKSNAKIQLPINNAFTLQEVEIDLSDFFYCGGDLAGSVVPNLAGLSTVGVGVIKYQDLIDNPNFSSNNHRIIGCGMRGTSKIQLNQNHMPKHSHPINNSPQGLRTGSVEGHTHNAGNLTTDETGSHTHNNATKFVGSTLASSGGIGTPGGSGEPGRRCLLREDQPRYESIISSGLHKHIISGSTAPAGSHSHSLPQHSHTMQEVGLGQPYYTNPIGFACHKFMFIGKTPQETPDVPTTTIPISQVSGLENRLNTIEANLANLTTRVSTLEGDFSSLQNRVGLVEDELGNCVKLIPIGNAPQHIRGKIYAPDFIIEEN